MDHERNGHNTVTEGVRWRTGTIHVLGSRKLGEGAKGNDCNVCRSGGEECAGVCAWPRPSTNAFSRPSRTTTAIPGGQWAAPRSGAATDTKRVIPNEHGRAVNPSPTILTGISYNHRHLVYSFIFFSFSLSVGRCSDICTSTSLPTLTRLLSRDQAFFVRPSISRRSI